MRILTCLFLLALSTAAQSQNVEEPFSENGWYLSPHGEIRILVIFAEIDYDLKPGRDPQPNGAEHWKKGELPTWKDELFDPRELPVPKAMVSKYYHDISLGQYSVLGDYIPTLMTLKESEHRNLYNLSAASVNEANKLTSFRTSAGLEISDFDKWKDNGKPGKPKELGADDPHRFDHTMVIVRNSDRLTHGQGSTDAGTPGKLFGFDSDTQSRFGAMYGLPFEILKHEYNHMLLGGNNFHSGGGNAKMFESYFICIQGGWSMMGAATSSLLTCSGWDRDRLGWTAPDAPYSINAKNQSGQFVNGDIDPVNGDTGLFVLRDFVTSGDALRIKMPYLDEDEFPQWLWLENHQTESRNGSATDVFHYEKQMECVQKAVPGIYAIMQVDRGNKLGTDIYRGRADYLKPISARGSFDYRLRGDTVTFKCLWPGPTTPVIADDEYANPLCGYNDLELMVFNSQKDDILNRTNEAITPRVEIRNGREIDAGQIFGHSDQAFTVNGKNRLGLGTNPPLTNVLTLATRPAKDLLKGKKPNNRVIHISGISVELLSESSAGEIMLHVRNDDNEITGEVRWCGDSIVIHPNANAGLSSVLVNGGSKLRIDRSGTPTRINEPDTVDGDLVFSSATEVVLLEGASIEVSNKGKLEVLNGSTIHVMPGSSLKLTGKSKLFLKNGGKVVVHPGGLFENSGSSKVECAQGGCIQQLEAQ